MSDTSTRFSSSGGGLLDKLLSSDPLMKFAGGALSGIAGLIGGKSDQEKHLESLQGQAQGLNFQGTNFDELRRLIESGNTDFLNRILSNSSRSAPGGQGLGEALIGGQSAISRQLIPHMAENQRARRDFGLDKLNLQSRLV